ncbi:MAG TPA: FAD-dependent oxidoreductase [Blastocatellia bacterium]|nr:FAD-dependent oxidoreductase [Blastocatellia bacterium]
MAKVVVFGGGFAGVVAAESLARRLGPAHQIMLVSRHREFTFFPSLVRLAFGRCRLEEVFFDLIDSMRSQGVELEQAEVTHYDPDRRYLVIPRGKYERRIHYDYLVFAPGRRLAVESIPGFHQHAHHLLTVGDALKFGQAIKSFDRGHAVVGYCRGARLAVPVYETAFALDQWLRTRGTRDRVKITIVSPEKLGGLLGGDPITPVLKTALDERGIEFVPDYSVNRVTAGEIVASDGRRMGHDLLMLIPPFQGPAEARYVGVTDPNDYLTVDHHLRVIGADRMYAAGDCVHLSGPKMGRMAVLQAEVAASNLASEIEGRVPAVSYDHQIMLVIDQGGKDSIYISQEPGTEGASHIHQGRFWGWVKQVHSRYWPGLHSLKPIQSR